MKQINRFTLLCAAAVTLGAMVPASAARKPFFNAAPAIPPGAGVFDPEISIVNTGVVHDVQATVSADRRYVTLNTRASVSDLREMNTFTFQAPDLPAGFAGDEDPQPAQGQNAARRGNNNRRRPGNDAARRRADEAAFERQRLPSEVRRGGDSILRREGMTLIGSAVRKPRPGFGLQPLTETPGRE